MVGRTKVATKVVIRPCNVGASYIPGIFGTEILPELKMVTQGDFWCKVCKASTGYAEWRITIHRSSKMPGDRGATSGGCRINSTIRGLCSILHANFGEHLFHELG